MGASADLEGWGDSDSKWSTPCDKDGFVADEESTANIHSQCASGAEANDTEDDADSVACKKARFV